jgi:hypothetical protein
MLAHVEGKTSSTIIGLQNNLHVQRCLHGERLEVLIEKVESRGTESRKGCVHC